MTAPQAIIRIVPNGGTQSAGQIVDQLNYLTRKGTVDLQRSDRHQGVVVPSTQFAEEANSWVRQTGNNPEAAPEAADLTTHIVVSFPPPVDPEDAVATEHYRQRTFAAGRAWANRMFGPQTGDDPNAFDYMTVFHTDRQHPHLHVVVNRRSTHGDWLKISRRDALFNYDNMRHVLVDAAYDCSIELDATSRAERGITERPITYAQHRRLERERRRVRRAAEDHVGMDPETNERLDEALREAGADALPAPDENAEEGVFNVPQGGQPRERTTEDLRRGCTVPPAFDDDRAAGRPPHDDDHTNHDHDSNDADGRGTPPDPHHRSPEFDDLYDISDNEAPNGNHDLDDADIPHHDEALENPGHQRPRKRRASAEANIVETHAKRRRHEQTDTQQRVDGAQLVNEARQRREDQAAVEAQEVRSGTSRGARPRERNELFSGHPMELRDTEARKKRRIPQVELESDTHQAKRQHHRAAAEVTEAGPSRRRLPGGGTGPVDGHSMELRDNETRKKRRNDAARSGGYHRER